MKPYQAEKNMGRMKHFRHKSCKMLGDTGIKTKASILEAENADRAYKKAARQEAKRIINKELENEI